MCNDPNETDELIWAAITYKECDGAPYQGFDEIHHIHQLIRSTFVASRALTGKQAMRHDLNFATATANHFELQSWQPCFWSSSLKPLFSSLHPTESMVNCSIREVMQQQQQQQSEAGLVTIARAW